ncbi:MAG: peptidoglycan endopeptidase [Deltaproteobacteria bacterium]|nr:peptidoglycan endopeptidase [Deltaproteobacteria bacterium]
MDFPVFSVPWAVDLIGKKSAIHRDRTFPWTEYIAVKGDLLNVKRVIRQGGIWLYQVTGKVYPCKKCYIDSRVVKLSLRSEKKSVKPPSLKRIIENLKLSAGSRYCWGCNVRKGIRDISFFYPEVKNSPGNWIWTFTGLDCSGLLFEATNGFTPRNTSKLMKFGKNIQIEGKSVEQISQIVKPLDLILWPGHVVIVLDVNNVIESLNYELKKYTGKVVISSFRRRLGEIMKYRKGIDNFNLSAYPPGKKFEIRRWHPEILQKGLNR